MAPARTKVRFVWLLVDRRWGQRVREWAEGGGVGDAQGAQAVPSDDGGGGRPKGSGRRAA